MKSSDYDAWLQSVPTGITSDALWKIEAYRLALFIGDMTWQDTKGINQDRQAASLSNQLYRAVASISANIAEGYSRGSHKEKAHFYEYALGSARESRDWYYKVRFVLSDEVVEQRFSILNQIIRLLLRMIPNQRACIAKEETAAYLVESLTDTE